MKTQFSDNEISAPRASVCTAIRETPIETKQIPVTRRRRSHQKVRTGCAVCKRRRIKCDERKPSCQNCEKHRSRCAYLTAPERKRSQVHHAPEEVLSTSGSTKSKQEHSSTEHNNPRSVYPQSHLQDIRCLGTDSVESVHRTSSTLPPVINTYICPFHHESASFFLGVPPERRPSPWLWFSRTYWIKGDWCHFERTR